MTQKVLPLSSLHILARYAPAIFGRALNPEAIAQCLSPSTGELGRAPSLDNNTPEVRAALAALRVLQVLHDKDPAAARVLCYAHVVCHGPTDAVLVEIATSSGYDLLPPPPKPPPQSRRKRETPEARRAREDATQRMNAYLARWAEARRRGRELYAAAVQAWETVQKKR